MGRLQRRTYDEPPAVENMWQVKCVLWQRIGHASGNKTSDQNARVGLKGHKSPAKTMGLFNRDGLVKNWG